MSTISAGTTSTTTLIASGDTTGSLVFKTNDTGSGGTTAMTIDTSQNVGIGTSSPATKLHVVSTTLPQLRVEYNSSYYTTISNNGTFNVVDASTSNWYTFQRNGTAQMVIDNSGNVGIGTSSPGYKLSLQDSANFAIHLLKTSSNDGWIRNIGNLDIAAASGGGGGQIISFSIGANYAGLAEAARIEGNKRFLIGTTSGIANGTLCVKSNYAGAEACSFQGGSNNYIVTFHNTSGTLIGSITGSSGSTTSYNTSSDYRLKENIQPMTGALTKVAALKPVTYKWKADGSDGQGFIAHELAEVCPDAVSGEKDAVNEDGSIRPQGIDTSFLVATLTAAIQELKAELDATKAEVAALKGQK